MPPAIGRALPHIFSTLPFTPEQADNYSYPIFLYACIIGIWSAR